MNRRWRVPRVARARRFEPPFITVAATPPPWVPESAGRSRPREAAARRGRSFSTVPAQVQVAAPAFVSPQLRAALKPRYALRRGKFVTVPPATVTPPQSLRPTTRRMINARRARYTTVLDRGVPMPMQPLRAVPRRIVLSRRGRFLTVPIPLPVSSPLVPPPLLRQPRRLQILPRRGHVTNPVQTQIVATAPGFVPTRTRRPRRVIRTRRGQFLTVPLTVVTPTLPVDITVVIGPTRILEHFSGGATRDRNQVDISGGTRQKWATGNTRQKWSAGDTRQDWVAGHTRTDRGR